MQLDWARYSAEDTATQGGHRWREGSRPEEACPRLLKSYTELPAYAEGQRHWTPFYAGFSADNELTLIYVEPNTTPGRPNRVNARALFVPLTVDDLHPALNTLRDPSRFTHPVPVTLVASAPVISNTAASEVAQVLQAFSEVRRQQVVLRSEDEAVFLTHLWKALWPEARRTMTFRRHFHPQELPEPSIRPQIILVPDLSPWQRERQMLLANELPGRPSMTPVGSSDATAFMGGLSHLRIYHRLQQALQTPIEQQDTSQLQRTWGLLESVPLTSDFREKHCAAIRAALQRRIPMISAEALLSLAGISDHADVLKAATQQWVVNTLQQQGAAPSVTWTDLVAIDMTWLGTGLREGLQTLDQTSQVVQNLTPWLTCTSGRLLLMALNDDCQKTVVQHLPTALSNLAEIQMWAYQRGWWMLHAVAAVRQHQTHGLKAILQHTPESELDDALHALTDEIEPLDLLNLLSQTQDARTIRCAAQVLSHHAQARVLLDSKSSWWRQIWTSALPKLGDPFQDVVHPEQQVDGLLDELLNGEVIPAELLQAIARTPQANILRRDDRAALWKKLPSPFLAATAAAYVQATDDPGEPDPTLLQEIIGQRQRSISPLASRHLIDHLPALHPDQARRIVQQWPEREKERVLHIAKRRPKFLANLFSGAIQHAPQWAVSLLPEESQLELAAFRQQALPDALWWRLAHRIIPELVVEPPMRFWVAAGGNGNDLEESGNTRKRWAAALERSRFESGPHIAALLDEVLSSYRHPHLEQLRQTKIQGE